MAKDLISGLILTPSHKLFRGFYLYQQLEIVPSNHPMQFPQKLLHQISEDGKKANFGPNFGLSDQDLGCQIFFSGFYLCQYLHIIPSYHPMQFKRKLINQTCEYGKKPNFGSNCSPNLDPQFFFVSFTSTRFKKLLQDTIVWNFKETNEPNLKMATKT